MLYKVRITVMLTQVRMFVVADVLILAGTASVNGATIY